MSDQRPKLTHHYGRGGAGNVTSKEGAIVEGLKTTPTLKSATYTTGRGGHGNMAKLDPEHPEEARQAQDVNIPPILLPEGQNRTGRGGIANVYTPSNQEVENARLHNERVRRESLNKKDASLKQRIVKKARDKLPGKSPSREPSERA